MPSRSKKHQAKRLRLKKLIEFAEPTHKFMGVDEYGFACFETNASPLAAAQPK
jgi:hypothetical protein